MINPGNPETGIPEWKLPHQNYRDNVKDIVTGEQFKNSDNAYLGNLMHIHVNIKYIEVFTDSEISDLV